MKTQKLKFVLCGEIGTGKTHFLYQALSRKFLIDEEVLPDEVDPEKNVFLKFLSDQKKYCYDFELYMLPKSKLRLSNVTKGVYSNFFFSERVLPENVVFLHTNNYFDNLNQTQLESLEETFSDTSNLNFILKPPYRKKSIWLFIYTSYENMIKNIERRNRKDENYPKEYLIALRHFYLAFLSQLIKQKERIYLLNNNEDKSGSFFEEFFDKDNDDNNNYEINNTKIEEKLLDIELIIYLNNEIHDNDDDCLFIRNDVRLFQMKNEKISKNVSYFGQKEKGKVYLLNENTYNDFIIMCETGKKVELYFKSLK